MERAGISLKSKLFSSNPWAKEGCSGTDCFPCKPREGERGESAAMKMSPIAWFVKSASSKGFQGLLGGIE